MEKTMINRFTYSVMVAVICCSHAWLGTVAPAQAATVTDRFELKGTVKEWCQGNPKFFEIDTLKATDNSLLTITRDVNGDGDDTDITATFGLTGGEPDVILMKGRALPANQSGSIAQLALSGRNPGNPDHFVTIRGHATFDKLGNLTKVTGTLGFQITDTYSHNKSAAVNCFGSGTFATGKKVTSVGGGMLTIPDAPASVGGTFVAEPPLNKSDKFSFDGLTFLTILWGELPVASPFHDEVLALVFNPTHHLVGVVFGVVTLEGAKPLTKWKCIVSCAGVNVDRNAGTASFTDTVLEDSTGTNPPLPPITLNGTMTFTPF
jgi:hypothetical protein